MVRGHKGFLLSTKFIKYDPKWPNVRLFAAKRFRFIEPELRSQIERSTYLPIFIVPLKSVTCTHAEQHVVVFCLFLNTLQLRHTVAVYIVWDAVLNLLSCPEISNFSIVILCQEYIEWFEISMQYAFLLMQVLYTECHLDECLPNEILLK